MDTNLLRQLWSVVVSSPQQRFSTLDDSGIEQWLTDALRADPTFESRDLPAVNRYIRTRMPLIRELAQQP